MSDPAAGLDRPLDGLVAPAGLMVASRIANMVVGLATIPVLIHYLGGEGFAAWALLLAISAGFSALELGMSPTYVKHAAGPIQAEDWAAAGATFAHVAVILVAVYGVSAPLVWLFADDLARLVRLPDGKLLGAAAMIRLVFVAVAIRALAQLGGHTLYAAMRFRAVAVAAFFQPLASNLAACSVAVATRRLDLTLAAYWLAQVGVVALVYLYARHRYLRRFLGSALRMSTVRAFCAHGLRLQVYDWAQFVNFQFDKFLIAWLVGLWAVAPYEVANRSMLALRSIPASGIETFLPSAAMGHASVDAMWGRFLSMTRIASVAVTVFMIVPIVVAPLFLYAWTGEMGYVGRWAFVALMVGGAANVLAIPAAALAQATGRTDLLIRSALAAMLINIPVSFILVLHWELAGAATGSAVAMVLGACVLTRDLYAAHARALGPTVRALARSWPLLLACTVFAALAYIPFEHWIAAHDPAVRFSRDLRWMPALLAVAGYLAFLAALAGVRLTRADRRVTEVSWRELAGIPRSA